MNPISMSVVTKIAIRNKPKFPIPSILTGQNPRDMSYVRERLDLIPVALVALAVHPEPNRRKIVCVV